MIDVEATLKPKTAGSMKAHGLNADLHSHSSVSDGTLPPATLARRARDNGVGLWALTDHDELAGQREARDAAGQLGLPYLSGVEVSVSFAGSTVHIVGLGVDIDDSALHDGLRATRAGRAARAQAMGDALAQAGIAGAFDGALRHAGNPALVSRTHFARFLVESGVCRDTQEVFRNYLVRGRPGYVAHRWASLADAVRWITQAGGVAIVAHPGRYRFTANEEAALFAEFKAHGGRGVEVLTGSHSPADAVKYAALAQAEGLLASRGSDFHAPGESRVDLGRLPGLPGTLAPVWDALRERVQQP